MNSQLMVIFILQLSVTTWGKAVTDSAVADAVNNPRYAFNYAMSDSLTRDNKVQYEERDGDLVNDAYSLLEPVGNFRLVEYSEDDINGFSAIVKNLVASFGQQPITKLEAYPLPPINPLIDPRDYGFGAAPLGVGVSHVKITGSSLPWDPKTGSFGGWVPININGRNKKITYATILRKKYVNGQLKTVVYRPIPLRSKSVIIIKKRNLDD